MRALLGRLGNPEEGFPSIHVTGSHGKGSVVSFLEAAFAASGYRVGVLSPSSAPQEMVRLSAEPVPQTALEPYLSRVDKRCEVQARPVEKLAAAAFLFFAEEEVEIAVVGAEVGGRNDLANCLPHRLLTLVTCVEEDRVDLFGRGWTRASWEEAHTASPGVPLLTVERKVEALAAFAEATKRAGGALVILDPDEVQGREFSWDRVSWGLREDPLGLGEFSTPPLGLYQQANLALALGALCELVGGWELGRDAIKRGWTNVKIPGRFEVISRRPYVVLDAARNPAAAASVVKTLEAMPDPGGRRTLLFAIHRGQPVRSTAEVLFPAFDEVILCSGADEELLPAQALRPQARRLGVRCRLEPDPLAAVVNALEAASPEDLIVVVAPKKILAEVRRGLGRPA
jgi:dihydrofolate synthase/folylpolyglutamate synthase